MRKLFFLFSVLAVLASCGPSTYTLAVDVRKPSATGMDIAGKSMSVVYLTDGTAADSLFQATLAQGFSSGIENELFDGEQSIALFSMKLIPGADYSSRDTLVNLLMDTGTDVVFLFDDTSFKFPETLSTSSSGLNHPDSTIITKASLPFDVTLYSYDACDKKDAAYTFKGKSQARLSLFTSGKENKEQLMYKAVASSSAPAFATGTKIAESYFPKWQTDAFTLYYYENDNWYQALYFAEAALWERSILCWMKELDTNNLQKRSAAEYNLSLACYMLGQYNLALEWLERSDEDYLTPLSTGMRKRISEKL